MNVENGNERQESRNISEAKTSECVTGLRRNMEKTVKDESEMFYPRGRVGGNPKPDYKIYSEREDNR